MIYTQELLHLLKFLLGLHQTILPLVDILLLGPSIFDELLLKALREQLRLFLGRDGWEIF